MTKGRDHELEVLLNFNGHKYHYDSGHYVEIKVRIVEKTIQRPHGLKYSLNLHEKNGTRIFGIDNAHGYDLRKHKMSGRRVVYDHKHKMEKVYDYDFVSPPNLIDDFFKEVNKMTK